MTRSIKALSGAAMLAALVLPAAASAQDTSSTGGRVTRDSASGRNMNGVRFDTTQAVTLTGVTIVRIDSLGGNAAWNSGARGGMGASGAGSSAMGSTSSGSGSMTGSTASGAMGTTGGAAATGAMTHGDMKHGQTLSAIVRSGSDSMQIVLGPSDYLTSKQLMLSAGDVISIKGVRLAADASGMGAGAAGAMSGSATGGTTSAGSVTSTSSSGSTGTTIGATGASAAMSTILATEITKNGTTVALRDKSTGEPSWGTMGSDAGKNRGTMTPPSTMKKDTTMTKDSTAPPPVRKP